MFGGTLNHEARFFADGYELSGVESVSLSYSNSSSILKPLGTKKGLTTSTGPTQKTLSLSRVLTYNDPILNYTGEAPLSGSIYYSDDHYGFESGYLVDYSLNCAVGAVPRVNCNFQIASEIKSGVNGNTSPQSHPVIDIPTQGSISITCDNSTTNRVVGFDYGVKLNRKAYLTVGSDDVVKVELIEPLEYTATVQLEVDDAFLQDSDKFFSLKEDKNVSLNIQGRDGNELQSVTIPNASLIGESLEVSANGLARITLSYIGHTYVTSSDVGFDAGLSYSFNQDGSVEDDEAGDIPDDWKNAASQPDIYGLYLGTGVDIIGDRAFKDQVTLSGDVFIETASEVQSSAFEGCVNLKNNLVFGENLTDVGNNAFKDCGFVGALVFPESLNNLGDSAFENCSGFDGILELPTGQMQNLGDNAFKNCSKFIGDLNLPSVVDSVVPDSIFENCSGFNGSIKIAADYTNIQQNAFKNCSRLNGFLEIPNVVTQINSGAFENCSSLDGKLDFQSAPLNSIGASAFRNCEQLSDVLSMPNLVSTIGDGAFENCNGIQQLIFEGNSCNSIGDRAFKNCSSLAQGLEFKNANFSVGVEAFKNCTSLNGIIQGLDTANSIGSGAFENCGNLYGNLKVCGANGTTIPAAAFKNAYAAGLELDTSDATIIGQEAFRNTKFQTFNENFIDNATTISDRAFQNCTASYYITGFNFIQPSLVSIGEKAFKDCKNISGVLVFDESGYSLNSIGNEAFYGCDNIRNVATHIPPNSFQGANTLLGIRGCLYAARNVYDDYEALLDDGIFQGMPLCRGAAYTRIYNASYNVIKGTRAEVIPDDWYEGKTTPTPQYLDIGLNVTSIGSQAFLNSSALEGFLTIPGNVNTIGDEAFEGTSFNGELIIEEGVKSIGDSAFRDTNFTGSLTIPNSVTGIENRAFKDCNGLNGSLTIESTAATIGDEAFLRCSSLTGDLLITNASGIGSNSFASCSNINGILSIPNVLDIGSSAFKGCSNIVGELDVSSVTGSIGANAFENCSSAEGIFLGQKVTNIGDKAFQGCKNVVGSITLLDSLSGVGITVGDYAFRNCSGIEVAYSDVPLANLGVSGLQFQAATTSDKILYVRQTHFNDYFAAGGNNGYYDGNILQLWRLDDGPSIILDNASQEIASVTGDIPVEWRSGSNPNDETLILGSSVTNIGDRAFYKNYDLLGTVFIPSAVKSIGEKAFAGQNPNRTSYDSFIFREGLEEIKTYAFNFCDLTNLKLPASLLSVEDTAFVNAGNFETITIGENDGSHRTVFGSDVFLNTWADGGATAGEGSVVIKSSVNNIGVGSFGAASLNGSNQTWLGTLDIGCQTIDERAFEYNQELTNITFRDSVKYVHKDAFRLCTGLKYINIPDPISIGNIPYTDNNKKPDNNIFEGCFPEEIIIGNDNYRGVNSYIETEAIRPQADVAIDDLPNRCSVKIGSSIDSLKRYAFSRHSSDLTAGSNFRLITGIVCNARSIGNYCFKRNTTIKEFIGSGVSHVGYRAFIKTAYNLEKVVLGNNDEVAAVGDSSKIIEKRAFDSRHMGATNTPYGPCEVTIGSSIDSTDGYAFSHNFSDTSENDDSSINNRWMTKLNYNARSVGYRAFYRARDLKEVNFGPNVNSLNSRCFQFCRITGDILLERDGCYMNGRAFQRKDTSASNNVRMRNFYCRSPLSKGTNEVGGHINWKNNADDSSFIYMTGDFYVHPDYYDQWTGENGSTKINTAKVGESDILPWTTYPNKI